MYVTCNGFENVMYEITLHYDPFYLYIRITRYVIGRGSRLRRLAFHRQFEYSLYFASNRNEGGVALEC